MNAKQLREEMARIATNARAKFDEITDDTPAERAAEIEREFDAMMADHDRIGEKLARAERLEAAERAAEESADPRRPRGDDQEGRGGDAGEAPTYRGVFARMVCGADPIDFTAEERSVLRGGYVSLEGRAQVGGTAAAGGYTVPQELMSELVRTMLMWGPMYDPGVTREIVTTGGHKMTMPTVDDTATTAEPHTEGADLTDGGNKDVTFGEKQLDAYSYDTEWVKWSWELEADSILNMESVLGDLLGERLGRIANLRLTTGSGTGEPNGIVTASSAGPTATSATALDSDEIIDLIHSVDPAYRQSPGVRFMMNDTTIAAVRKLKDGDGNYLWQMGNIQQSVPPNLLGYNVSINQAMANISANARPIIFGDMNKYMVRKVGSPVIGVVREKFWPNLGIAGVIRFDGELTDSAAVKHLRMAAS